MTNMSDVDLTDTDLATEIELLAELIVAASESEGPLDERTIDLTLGLRSPSHAVAFPSQRRSGRPTTADLGG